MNKSQRILDWFCVFNSHCGTAIDNSRWPGFALLMSICISSYVRESGNQNPANVCCWNLESRGLESGIHYGMESGTIMVGFRNPESWNPESRRLEKVTLNNWMSIVWFSTDSSGCPKFYRMRGPKMCAVHSLLTKTDRVFPTFDLKKTIVKRNVLLTPYAIKFWCSIFIPNSKHLSAFMFKWV